MNQILTFLLERGISFRKGPASLASADAGDPEER